MRPDPFDYLFFGALIVGLALVCLSIASVYTAQKEGTIEVFACEAHVYPLHCCPEDPKP